MATKQHSISLPENASAILDSLPKGEKSQLVAEALLLLQKERARHEALRILDEIEPTDWGTDKDSVQLVQEARAERTGQILSNQDFQ
jgi:hypothetical protein